MNYLQKLNSKTNLMDAVAQQTITIEKLETTSKTNKNGKSYGFLHGRTEVGDLITGLAYKNTADTYGSVAVGSKVLVETLAANVKNKINNNWQLTVAGASPVRQSDADKAAAFLASLE